MVDYRPKLTDQEVLNRSRTLIAQHLPLQADGYTCTTDNLLDVLLGVAANRGTIEAVCADWVGAPDAETIRGYLNEQLRVEDLPELEKRLNAALGQEIPPRVRCQAGDVAIDFHDRPYYGKQGQATALWVRGPARDGTTRFYRVVTAYVMRYGLRVTLVVRFVLPEQGTVQVLKDVLDRVQWLGIRIKRLFLDKGFAGVAVQEYLTRSGQPTVIACPIRGRQGGTRALCQGHQSYVTRYTFQSGHTTWTAHLAVCRAFTTARRTQRMKRRATWLIFIVIHLDLSPRHVRRLYRRRFGAVPVGCGVGRLLRTRPLSLCVAGPEFRAAERMDPSSLVVHSSTTPWRSLARCPAASTDTVRQVHHPCAGATVWLRL